MNINMKKYSNYHISKRLGLDKAYNAVIIGVNNFCQAIHNYCNNNEFIKIEGIFYVDSRTIGLRTDNSEVLDIACLEDFLKDRDIDIAIVCVSQEAVDKIYKILEVRAIKGIWNFSDIEIKSTDKIAVENFSLLDSLEILIYSISSREK